MKKRNMRHAKKIRKLIVVCCLCAIMLAVSTYAWFVGMKTVNVASFDVDIATTEGLFLSMDGNNWSYRLDAKNATAYTGNTNSWAPTGLIPVSSVGDMDSGASRMKLYEKASLTTTHGGYRLLTSRVQNYNKTGSVYDQGKGYVVFDLFVKNLSGTEYYDVNEPRNEEAIYLTTNSIVKVSDNGGVSGTGIENSVRVAFTQIGRVRADAPQASITGITCSDAAASGDKVKVTGICRNAQIWEPNDQLHVSNAISWYNTSCRPRVTGGTDVTYKSSYNLPSGSGQGATNPKCVTLNSTNHTRETYVISRALGVADNVDVYDGAHYNGYTNNVVDYSVYNPATDKSAYKLVNYPFFTDSMKVLKGTSRPQFMTLAPNSVTKLRVYIYIEGQDVDNYDFASLGKKISVNFGFTKERYIETDIEYSGPSTLITDESASHQGKWVSGEPYPSTSNNGE